MGKSSTGKDTILRHLKMDEELKLKPVIPYTTRPIRINEVNGREYFFIDECELRKLEQSGKVIEVRKYNTVKGLWFYATINDGQIDINENNYILIGTLHTYKSLRNFYGDDKVIPIYIVADDGIRIKRAIKREQGQLKPNYDELCRRFLADRCDFDEEKISELNIEKSYTNNNFKRCINKIKTDILKNI